MVRFDFFPIGLYCVEDPCDFPDIASAGFNLIQPWRFEGGYDERYPSTPQDALDYLDRAQEAGLMVLMSLPLYADQRSHMMRFSSPTERQSQLGSIRERVLL